MLSIRLWLEFMYGTIPELENWRVKGVIGKRSPLSGTCVENGHRTHQYIYYDLKNI